MKSFTCSDALCVIPARNESEVICGVVRSLLAAGFRVLCVDDGSTDDTGCLAEECGASVIRHPMNLGQGAALESGFEAIRKGQIDAELVATFDADGQHLVSDLVAMVGEFNLDDELMVVLGSRFVGDHNYVPGLKRKLLRFSALLLRFTLGLRLTDRNNGMRMFRREVIDDMKLEVLGYGHADEILRTISKKKLRCKESPTDILYTEYSMNKGQPLINAVRIVFDRMLGA